MNERADEGDLRVVLVNTPVDAAESIARAIVEQRLAACVNVVPKVKSFYFWEGKLQEDDESTLLIKTRAALVGALTTAVKAIHPYSVPEVVALPIDGSAGNPDYLAWVRSETSRPA
ncbi:MAG: divalent-cation tolerance protein CutA [Polyangiaceae bacterium]|nr:divalent-cation tolerance protein CutA [Polyangiaceae bacterium]